jgi:hypothetical protein
MVSHERRHNCLYAVLKPQALKLFCRQRLAYYLVPVHIAARTQCSGLSYIVQQSGESQL